MSPKPRVIYWFRTDLRLHDSPALKAALDLEPECLYPIWCWDPHYVYRARVGPNRWQYLLDCQFDLSSSITKLNSKSKLFVIREAPQTVLVKLFKSWKISHLVFEKDTDAYARERDLEVTEMAKKAGVEVITKVGRTLYDPDRLVEANHGKPTMSISQVQQAAKKLPDVPKAIPAPVALPDPGKILLDFDQTQPSQEPDINDIQRSGQEKSYTNLAGPNNDFAVPTMAELGLKPAATPHRGGESIALSQLDKIIKDEEYTATFSKPATAPTAFSPQSTTLLSPHLHFGSLSVRLFYHRALAVINAYKKSKPSTIPTNLIGQLLFRDMYFGAQATLGHTFSQTRNNPQCRFIPWHLPSTISPDTGFATGSYTIDSASAERWFQRWKWGRTGFPWIDALMRQLRHEGWIHHLGRHAVACFLTRGGCYIDWERGADVFAEWLLDHEVACNAGNWQWLSCTAFYAQYYRCYSPIAFPRKWDSDGAFVRRYVPELAKYSSKFIYEPWRAPLADQKKWGCLIQGDGDDGDDNDENGESVKKSYPKPMFDFPQRRDFCIRAIKAAYATNLYGADSRVKHGSWKTLFDDLDAGDEGADGFNSNEKDDDDNNDASTDEDGKTVGETRKRGRGRSSEGKKGDGGRQMTIEGTFGGKDGKKRRR